MARTAVERQGWRNRTGGVGLAAIGVLYALSSFSGLAAVFGVAALSPWTVAEARQISERPDSQRPPRDVRRIPETPETAIIRGHIIDAETGQPIARAHVTLSDREAPVPALSGADGAFELRDLPAGEFAVAAEKATYDRGTYPNQSGTMRAKQLSLAPGQTLDGIVLPLYRQSAMSGRLTDAYGDPVESCAVQAFRVQRGGRLRAVQAAMTNDVGEFRLARMPAGTYLLLAQPSRSATIDRLRRSRSPVATQGASQDSSSNGEPSLMEPGGTFYPGVTELQQAQTVTIGRGQSATALDWSIAEVMKSVVSGRVVDANGQPASAGSVQVNVLLGEVEGRGLSVSSASVESDGRFRMKLQPGQYRLDLFVAGNGYRPTSGMASVFSTSEDSPPRIPSRYGRLDISVGGEPLTDLTLVLSTETTMTGRVVFEGDSPRPKRPQHVNVRFHALTASSGECRSFSTDEGVKADWTFRFSMLLGACVLEAGAPPPWHFNAVRHRGVDVTGRAFDFSKEADLSDVEVVLADRQTALTLDVHDESGGQTMEYVALVFPVDKSRWSATGYVQTFAPPPAPPGRDAATIGATSSESSEFMSFHQIDGNGRGEATLLGLPAGDYFIIALNDMAFEDSRELAFLEAVEPLATRVTLSDAGPQKVSLTRTTAPERDR
jgi:5-hydroxyisourate hydrolase-like protein (transthyretin family)